jgi:hypothetical protein
VRFEPEPLEYRERVGLFDEHERGKWQHVDRRISGRVRSGGRFSVGQLRSRDASVAGAGVGTIDARTAGPPGLLTPGSGGRRVRADDNPPGARQDGAPERHQRGEPGGNQGQLGTVGNQWEPGTVILAPDFPETLSPSAIRRRGYCPWIPLVSGGCSRPQFSCQASGSSRRRTSIARESGPAPATFCYD